MKIFYEIVTWLSLAAIVYVIIALIVGIRAIIKRKDAEYKILYEEHLERKHRVEKKLQRKS